MRVTICCIAMALVGCATNGYKQFYNELPLAKDVLDHRASPPPKEPKVDHLSGRFEDYGSQYARAGYVPIGYSSYNGANGAESEAVDQAKTVGADIVVVMSPRFSESRTTSIPIVTPTSQTTYTTGNATVSGSGGSANVYGNSTSTTYGSRTTYVPVTTNRYDFEAIYLVKRKYTLGAQYLPLTDEDRARIQSNKGVKISQVVDGTPAFEADILVGDIVLTANGRSISSPETFSEIISASVGHTLELSLLRSGQVLSKSIQL